MLPILTPAESAELDRASAARGLGVETLMENAGRAVARACVDVAGGAYGRRAAIVCGKGNNGGDGFVAARHLSRLGVGVTALVLDDPAFLTGAALANFRRYAWAGGRWKAFTEPVAAREIQRADVVVDALFGTGFRGRAEGRHARAIQLINELADAVVAVDIPSGVEGETGAVRGDAVFADLTVAMGALKPGVVFHPGAGRAGLVDVADIGFPPALVTSDLWMVEGEDVAALLPRRPAESHKRDAVVLILAGSRSMTGAPTLAGAAAYRAGAGLITLAVPEGILPVVQGTIQEATFLPLPQTSSGSAAEDAFGPVMERSANVQALAIGPGLSTDPSTGELVRRLVAESPIPVVLDADGLNAFAGRAALLAERASDLVITPHAGEFGRLAGLSSQEVLEDRLGHTRKAAREFRCPVLLKGSRTVVVDRDGRARVSGSGGSVLATAGTGDVLTGVIAGLIARGLDASDAAVAGAYVHGVAGALCAADLGEGTVASDVMSRLPRAMALTARLGT
jgi:NAD(P)H-hydrate epimerase